MTLSILLLVAVTIVLVLAIPVVENLAQEAQGQIQEETNITQLASTLPTIIKPTGVTPLPESISNNTSSSSSVAQEQEQNELLTQTKTNQTGGMLTYDNKTLGISFEYPNGWEVSQWDFSDESEDELTIAPKHISRSYDRSDPKDEQVLNEAQETEITLQVLPAPETLEPNTLQLERVTAQEYCDDLRASLSDKTLETGGFSEPYTYWLSNQIGRDEITKVANQTACRIESIELRDDVQESFTIEVYVPKDDKAYLLKFNAARSNTPTLAPIYDKMIESFRLLNKK
jgi:hypothetical protein